MIDVLVVVVVLFGALLGALRGFVVPAVAVGTMLLALYVLYAGPGAVFIPAGGWGIGLAVLLATVLSILFANVVDMLVSLVHRFTLVKAADRVLGVPLGAAAALVGVYLALVAVLSFDALLAPLHGKASVDQAAVAALRSAVEANPQFGMMVDPETVETLATKASAAAVPAEELAKIDASLAFYETTFRPALVESSLAPLILAFGEKAPFIGRTMRFPTP